MPKTAFTRDFFLLCFKALNIKKANHTIRLFARGFCLEYVGSLSRIMHRGEAATLMVLATVLKVLGILLLAYKVVRYEGFRKFMER